MQVGFFFWPYTPELCEQLADRADRYGYAMIGIADTPGNAMDPWISALLRLTAQARPALWRSSAASPALIRPAVCFAPEAQPQ